MFFATKYRYLFIFCLSVYAYLNTAFCKLYYHFNIPVQWYFAFTVIFLITAFVWEASRLSEPLFAKWFPQPQQIIKRASVFLASSIVVSTLFTAVLVVAFTKLVLNTHISLTTPLKLTITYAGLVNLLFHLLNMIFYYQQQYRQQVVQSEELKKINAQAELHSVKQQINPHFLFNNLNVLSGLVLQKSAEANHFIEAFSKVYMHILNHYNQELILLGSELNFLKPYTYLLEQRFPGAVDFDIQVPNKYQQYFVVPVCLQMLVENAVKHNVVSVSKPLHIRIYTNDNNMLCVENNKQPRLGSQVPSGNVGLANISKRYELTTGQTIHIESNGQRFMVELPLIQISLNENVDN